MTNHAEAAPNPRPDSIPLEEALDAGHFSDDEIEGVRQLADAFPGSTLELPSEGAHPEAAARVTVDLSLDSPSAQDSV